MSLLLRDIVSPLDEISFFSSYWDQKFLYVEGTPGRFTGLFSWELLNDTINTHRFTNQRLKVYRAGRQIPPNQFISSETPQVDSSRLMSLMEDGSTLILQGADEVSRPLQDLMLAIESSIHTPVYTNLYASWKQEPAFGVHCDPQDTFILQVYGRKRWRVWNPTRLHPLSADAEEAKLPDSDPVWDMDLIDGSVLYIPRGWWHEPKATGEPCLHLTVTMPNRSGIDLLHWMAEEMKKTTLARQNVPLASLVNGEDQYSERMMAQIREFWSDDIVSRYRDYLRSHQRVRPSLDFPPKQR